MYRTTNIVQEEYEWKHGLGLDNGPGQITEGEKEELDRGCLLMETARDGTTHLESHLIAVE